MTLCTDDCIIKCEVTFLDHDIAFVNTYCNTHGQVAHSRPIRGETALLIADKLIGRKREETKDDDDYPYSKKQARK